MSPLHVALVNVQVAFSPFCKAPVGDRLQEPSGSPLETISSLELEAVV
jgi:hypothetical protein